MVVATLVVLVTVGLGGLEKLTSEDSLSDEVDSEDDDDDDDDEDASTFVIAVVTGVDLGASSADSLSDGEVSEEVFESGLATAFVVAAGLETADSLSDAEASEEDEELTDGLETEPLIRGCEMTGLDISFFTGTAFALAEEEVLESDSDSELGELLGLAFRFNPFTNSVTVGFFEAAGIDSAVPAFSSSSSASLSELEPDAESDGLILDVDACDGVASFISTSESLPSSLFSLLLLLVMSFAITLAAASSRALASAFISFFAFFAFLDFLAALVLSLSSVSLLLVSSTRGCSW